MMETVITSSLLIAALLFLRMLFSGKISRRLQYGLWLLVALRLLLPVSLAAPFSVMNAIDTSGVQRYVTGPVVAVQLEEPVGPGALTPLPATPGFSPAGIIAVVWAGGAVLVGGWFLGVNLVFYGRLRKQRKKLSVDGCRLPVYRADAILSPCLFGLPRPSLYLTSCAADDPQKLRHVVTHELCHYAHLDHLWSVLRCVCVTLYWFNPFVWAAAVCSRYDCELACDESAVRLLGEGQRVAYGRTLVELIAAKPSPATFACTATTMAAGKRGTRERLAHILQAHKTWFPVLVAVLVAVCVLVGCTFTGAPRDTSTAQFTATVVRSGEPDVSTPVPVPPAEQVVQQLVDSVHMENGELVFTVPEQGVDGLNVVLSGRMVTEEGMGMSFHLFENENANSLWVKGQRYATELGGKNYTELLMEVVVPDQTTGEVTDRLVDLSEYLPQPQLSEDTTVYSRFALSFPAYQGGRTEYNGAIYDTKPFTLSLDLPEGWQIKAPQDTEVQFVSFFTPVELYHGERYIGYVGFDIFPDYKDVPPEQYDQAVYSDIRLGSLYYWGEYKPIYTTEKTETALAVVYDKLMKIDGKSAAEVPFTEVPGILSYDKDMLVYVGIQFAENTVTEAQVRAIAESMVLEPAG